MKSKSDRWKLEREEFRGAEIRHQIGTERNKTEREKELEREVDDWKMACFIIAIFLGVLLIGTELYYRISRGC